MTSRQPQQRPAHHSPPLNPREAALVGALTAFAKRPAQSRSPNRAAGQHGSKQPPAPPPRSQSTRTSVGREASTSPPKRVQNGPAQVEVRGRASNEDQSQGIRGIRPPEKQEDTHQDVKPGGSGLVISNPATGPYGDASGGTARPETGTDSKTDTDTIPSTSSLVKLYESKGTATAIVRPGTPLKSPKPIRRSLVLDQDDRTVSAHLDKATAPQSQIPVSTLPRRHISVKSEVSSIDSFKSAQDSLPPATLPKTIVESARPSLPPRRQTAEKSAMGRSLPHEAQTSASQAHSLPTQSSPPYLTSAGAASTASIQATYNALYPRKMSALRTGDSLANAIVASSLASSRAPSPNKASPQPQYLRSKHSHHSLFARTPSPNKLKPSSTGGFSKHTLRKDKSSSSGDDGVQDDDPYFKHKRKRHLHKHANKYAEGDRKRWRNAVTETERDRYEGVWAANRGLLADLTSQPGRQARSADKKGSWRDDERALLYGQSLDQLDGARDSDPGPDHGEDVHGFVVRDIWGRSRLPSHILEEIWSLVDLGGAAEGGWLSKEEFVVGMWLVDQRLKGHKLPVRVSDSIWDSVRFIKGLKIRSAKKGR